MLNTESKILSMTRPNGTAPPSTTLVRPGKQAVPAVKESARSLEIKQRFAELPSGLGTKLMPFYHQGIGLLNKDAETNIKSRFDLGGVLLRVRSQFGTNGDLAISALADAWNRSRTELSHMLLVAERITDEELAGLVHLNFPSGRKFSWMHLVALASEANKTKRAVLAKQAAAEEWSYDTLTESMEVSKPTTETTKSGGGRPFKQSTNLQTFAHKSTKEFSSTLRYVEEVLLPNIQTRIEETPPDKITLKTLSLFDELYHTTQSLRAKVQESEEQLQEAIAKITAALSDEPDPVQDVTDVVIDITPDELPDESDVVEDEPESTVEEMADVTVVEPVPVVKLRRVPPPPIAELAD